VDDVLQAVFLAVWRTAHAYRDVASIVTRILRTTHHQAVSALRGGKRRTGLVAVLRGEALAETQPRQHPPPSASHEDEIIGASRSTNRLDASPPSSARCLSWSSSTASLGPSAPSGTS